LHRPGAGTRLAIVVRHVDTKVEAGFTYRIVLGSYEHMAVVLPKDLEITPHTPVNSDTQIINADFRGAEFCNNLGGDDAVFTQTMG
jgi:hypothetical protein